jgi:hypothetical protein
MSNAQVDAVQCGHFRTGRYQSYQRLLESESFEPACAEEAQAAAAFQPDAVSMVRAALNDAPCPPFTSHGAPIT